ncbi:MAG: peptide MFS transporter [Pseudomonadota bacterium]
MLKGHPKGLYVLFFANMGERFGYYTMLSIFVLYLQENFGWDAEKAGQIYGYFLFGVYFMPLFGGWLADKVLGYGKTIAIGTLIMSAGYALLATPTDKQWMVFAALGVISVGNGMFKGNLAVIVGNLYGRDKGSLRDAAFNIYYMGINIGAFFAPYAASAAKDYIHGLGYTLAQGYNAGFAIAGAGMIVSFIIFLAFRKHYRHADYRSEEKKGEKADEILTEKQEKDRIMALLIVFAIVIFFWMAFHQNGFTLTLFAKNYTSSDVSRFTYLFFDLPSFLAVIAFLAGAIFAIRRSKPLFRALAGIISLAGLGFAYYKYTLFADSNAITPELFQAFNPIFIVFITPLIIGFFAWLNSRKKEPSSPAKIGIGMMITCIGFCVMAIASQGLESVSALNDGKSAVLVTPYWLVSTYFIMTLAELFLSPMGLSFVSKVAPPKLRGLMQGGWLGATAVGNLLAGLIGKFYKEWELYQFFLLVAGSCLLSAVLVLLVLKKLKAATQ